MKQLSLLGDIRMQIRWCGVDGSYVCDARGEGGSSWINCAACGGETASGSF